MRRSVKQFLQRSGRESTGAPETPTTASSAPGSVPSASPVARYDKLSVNAVLGHLNELAPKDLNALGHYERTHQNRTLVVAEIDARLGREPWPGYDEIDVDGVRFGLDGADADRFVTVLAYERAHRNRAGVVLAAQQAA